MTAATAFVPAKQFVTSNADRLWQRPRSHRPSDRPWRAAGAIRRSEDAGPLPRFGGLARPGSALIVLHFRRLLHARSSRLMRNAVPSTTGRMSMAGLNSTRSPRTT